MVFFEDHLIVTLSASKIDSFRKEVSIFIATTNDAVCAVILLRNLFKRFLASAFAPLFQDHHSKIFSADRVTTILRNAITNLEHESNYSGHFFRRSAATEVRNAGVPDDLIQLLRRWKSEAFLLYIEFNKKYILQASRHHQGG